ncbi:MAG: thioesterase family protein [Verrucomicrobia bacterium]|nr:thioesterase family protein [Verrucomicrobiota bacterium]
MSTAILEHTITLEPAFHDLDPMAVVWHGNYFKYFEIARTGLLRLIGYDYPQMQASGYAWPVVDCSCRFAKPIAYGQTIRITAALIEYENRLKINYVVNDDATGNRLCKASTTQVALDMATQEACFITPDAFQSRVRKTVQSLSA